MTEELGLKRLRWNRYGGKPKHFCSNCKCYRYSPCECSKGKRAASEVEVEDAKILEGEVV